MDTSLTDKDFQTLRSLGINLIRLGVMWPGVEPKRGQYDMAYLDKVEQIVQNAANYGIYILVDMHQDVLSEKFCGEGIPAWATITSNVSASKQFPVPVSDTPFSAIAEDGFPTRQDCAKYGWAQYYSTFATSNAFEILYTDVNGILANWSAFWYQVAQRLHKYPSVLGYELINEPWAGDVFAEPKRLIPSIADREVLQPAYDKLSTSIRQADPSALVFFAAVTWDDPVPVGFTAPPGGAAFADRSVLAYHFYKPPQFTEQIYFHQRNKDAQRLNVASVLTEFERPNLFDSIEVDPFVAAADAADKYIQSWAMWEFKTFCKETEETINSNSQQAAFGACKTGYGERLIWNDDGELNPLPCRKLARTFPAAVAGNITSFSFNATTSRFHVQWSIDTTVSAPTTIYMHFDLNYPNGVDVNVLPLHGLEWSADKASNTLSFRVSQRSSLSFGDSVTVSITQPN